jgi:hypothetical protein
MKGLLRAVVTARELRPLYDGARAKVRRIAVAIVAVALAAAFAVAALIWLDIALYLYCRPQFGSPIAALIAAGAFVVVALLALLPLALISSRPPPRSRRIAAVDESTAAAVHDLAELVKRNKGAIIVAATLAGLVLGTKRR